MFKNMKGKYIRYEREKRKIERKYDRRYYNNYKKRAQYGYIKKDEEL